MHIALQVSASAPLTLRRHGASTVRLAVLHMARQFYIYKGFTNLDPPPKNFTSHSFSNKKLRFSVT
jgi:hypothetical protein